ncbi:hypothetical protein ACFL1B_05800 [Nanoarchaeota archaeon]
MEQVTLVGHKAKEEGLVSDFTPIESDCIMRSLAQSLKNTLDGDLHCKEIRNGQRIEKIKLYNDSIQGHIIHVPIDTFGEKHAEVRAVLNVSSGQDLLEEAITSNDFSVTVT